MRVEHIGIVVRSIEEATKIWANLFGFNVKLITNVEAQKVRIAVIDAHGLEIELIEPISTDSPIAKFLAKRGIGLHHICFEVKKIDSVISDLENKGVRLIDKYPRPGALAKKVAFLHPSSACGVLVEIAEK